MKPSIVLIIFIYSSVTFSQTIVDAVDQKPLTYAEIYSADGTLIGATNLKGELDEETKSKLNKECRTFSILHLGYETLKVSLEEENCVFKSVYELTPLAYSIPEIVVSPKESSDKNYSHLIGSYRSWQYNDDVLFYFQTGTVHYQIKTKNNSFKVKRIKNLKSNYEHDSLQNSKENIIVMVVGPPSLERSIMDINEKLDNAISIIEVLEDSIYQIFENKRLIGSVLKTSPSVFTLFVDLVDPENPFSKSLWGYKNKMKKDLYTVRFSATTLDDCDVSTMTYFKNIMVYSFTTKNSDQVHHIKSIREFNTSDFIYSDSKKIDQNDIQYSFSSADFPRLPRSLMQKIRELRDVEEN